MPRRSRSSRPLVKGEGLGEDAPASALTGGVAMTGAILSSLLSDDCRKNAQESPPKQGCPSTPTILPGTLPSLFHLLLPPPLPTPSAPAPSTLPGSCSSHCCHQPGQDVVLGHSGLPGVKANMKLSFQVGKRIKRGLNKTQRQQGRTTNVVSISAPHPCMGGEPGGW